MNSKDPAFSGFNSFPLTSNLQKTFLISGSTSVCNLAECVKSLKNFRLEDRKDIRELLIKSGMKLFYELHDNLNSY